jgi:hypothetical protein
MTTVSPSKVASDVDGDVDTPSDSDVRETGTREKLSCFSLDKADEFPMLLFMMHPSKLQLPEELRKAGGRIPLHGEHEGYSVNVIPNAPPDVSPVYLSYTHPQKDGLLESTFMFTDAKQRDHIARNPEPIVQSFPISRASVTASFPVDAMLGRYAALLRRCSMFKHPAPVICKTSTALFDYTLNNIDAYDDAELDDVDRLFCDSKTRSALVSRTEECTARHHVVGHHVVFTPALGEVARLLATLISIEELESTCRRVYFDARIIGMDEGESCNDKHVGSTVFWFVPIVQKKILRGV